MSGHTWKEVNSSISEQIKTYLLDNGGIQAEVKGQHEVWRVKFSDLI